MVVAVDIVDDGASEIVQMAADWAQRMNATLDVAFVDEYQFSTFLIRDAHLRELFSAQRERVWNLHRAALRDLVNEVPEAVRGESLFLAGRAHEELLAVAADRDVLLVATRGHKGLEHVVLGSVAERLVRFASVPVVVLRLPSDDTPSASA